MSNTVTEKQITFIGSLLTERKQAAQVDDIDAFLHAIRDERLSGVGASALIGKLMTLPKDGAAVRGNLPENRYPGDCVNCGHEVAARAGTYRRGARGGWETLHLPGQCPAKADVPAPTKVVADDTRDSSSWSAARSAFEALPDGSYAVPSVTGTNDLTFFKISTNQGRYNPSNKGKRYFNHLVGGDQEFAVTPAFILKCVEAVHASGGAAAAQGRFGLEHRCCGRCGRSLTDEESRRTGLGPECRSKF